MAKIEIYIKTHCPYCVNAVTFFRDQNLEFKMYNVESDPAVLQEMRERSNNAPTVPQIFINDKGIGGYSDMMILHSNGKLDQLLK